VKVRSALAKWGVGDDTDSPLFGVYQVECFSSSSLADRIPKWFARERVEGWRGSGEGISYSRAEYLVVNT